MVTRPSPDDAVVHRAFEELGQMSFAEHSLQSLIQQVTDLAAQVLPGDAATSVTIVEEDRGPRTVAASGPDALDLDFAQYEVRSGPCLEAAATGRPVEIRDTAQEARWPHFAQRAAQQGFRSVFSIPLPVQELVAGSLNVYARLLVATDGPTHALASRFASYAVVPVSNMYLYETVVERAGHLQAALDSRGVIDQAKGILMERFKLTADQAFEALTRVSMESNLKVRDVAERFVQTGELPPR
jgi:GAF domain-containing protein